MAWTYTRGIVRASNGAIATSHTLASQTGLHILRMGGSFADAAIATSAVLCVLEPSASHVGGDGFAVLWDGAQPLALNGSGRSPAGQGPDWRELGATSFTVPGLARIWQTLHESYGSLPMQTLLGDAIRYAEEGCPVGSRWANSAKLNLRLLRQDEQASNQFLVGGEAPQEGAIVRQPDLAASLQAIAERGPADFYEGALAQRLVEGLRALGSAVSAEDFQSQQTQVAEPIRVEYRGYEIHGQPPPSQGLILLEELGILRGFDAPPFGSPAHIHQQVEANKLAFADRTAYLGDPDQHPNPVDALLSEPFLARRRAELRPDRALPAPEAGSLGGNTTYFCIADGAGRGISFIQSIFYPWGSGVVAPGTGILLNNRMNGFDRAGEGPNAYAPNKRPLHTLNAYMATKDGKPAFLGGTPGAHIQVQTNLQVIQNLIDFDMDPQEAIERPRWRHDAQGLALEGPFPPNVIGALKSRGHRVSRLPLWGHGSAVQLIVFQPDGSLAAGSDPRAPGQALGW